MASQSLKLYEDVRDRRGAAHARFSLGEAARREGELDRAEHLLRSSLAAVRETGPVLQAVRCIESLAGVASRRGQCERGAIMYGAARELRARDYISSVPLPRVQTIIDADLEVLGHTLGDGVRDALLAAGQSLSLEEAILLGVGHGGDTETMKAGARGETSTVLVRLLGGLAAEQNGRTLPVSEGMPARVIVAVALGGTRHVEELIDQLWPDANLETGRRRLKNVLSRLRSLHPGLIERDGPLVRLAPDVVVDAVAFEETAKRALGQIEACRPGADTLCRDALSLYRGELLPACRYDDTTTSPRVRLADDIAPSPVG